VAAVSDVGPEEIRADFRKIARQLARLPDDGERDAVWARRIAQILATEQRFSSSDLMVMYHLVAGMEVPMAAGLMSQILRHLRRINRR
jgi:hypothetical protein